MKDMKGANTQRTLSENLGLYFQEDERPLEE